MRRLFQARHEAVSYMISVIMVTAMVIGLSLIVLAWTQGMSLSFVQSYGATIDADIARLKERLSVEYIHYNSSSQNVTIYMLNCGMIDDVKIQSIHIYNATWSYSQQYDGSGLKSFAGADLEDLDIGEEGYIVLSPTDALYPGFYYYITLTTVRGATFDTGLVV
jgi:hypothetical protein